MRCIKFGFALLAALAFGVAMAAPASAGVFLSSVENAKLLSEGVAEQVFNTNPGEVKCTEAKIEKGEALPAANQQLAEIKYGKCLAFGFVPTAFTNADYNFLAGGQVHIQSLIKIVSNGCEILIKPQLVGTVKYSNSGNNIKLEPNITGITYTAKGCISGNGTASNGTYTGNSEAMIAGGTLSFMPNGGQEEAIEAELAQINNPFELEAIIIGIKAVGLGGPILGGTCKLFKIYAALAPCTVEQDPPVHFVVKWMAF